VTPGCSLTWQDGHMLDICLGMGLLSPSLAAILAIAAVSGHLLASIAREVRLMAIAWLALRGTRPDERPEILRALAASPPHVGRTESTREAEKISDSSKERNGDCARVPNA
jgi:hypothetical protein